MEHKISKLLIKNYLNIKRDLPWRNTDDPYKIWLSEVILQQTRVNQGMPYYLNFVENYPDVKSMAQASEDEILKMWQGLGYYSRARNMLRTAKAVYETYGNNFPSSYEKLIALKGIGNYTASAVSSFSANETRAVVDGNVNRVISRLFGIKERVDTAAGKKIIADAAESILNTASPGLHNQAIMEHGALICIPKNPRCEECPLTDVCLAFAEKKMADYPFKKEKKEVKKRFMLFWMIEDGKQILLQKRDESDIWGGLYQFPLIETDTEPNEESLLSMANVWKLNETGVQRFNTYPAVKHILTHRQLILRFVHLTVKKLPILENSISVNISAVREYPFPIVIAKFLNRHYADFLEGDV